ncbi:glycoside hydrolase family 75 protein, partial [Streptomyces montanisoli]
AAPAPGTPGSGGTAAASPGEGTVSAARLLARTAQCDQVSDGRYRNDDSDDEPTVAVCATAGAVYWKSDMDIDCDGKVTRHCNEDTDGSFQDMTAFTRSDGAPLDAAKLPYLVVPDPSDTWDYRSSGIRGGGLAAVVYHGRVEYAVVGDTGPAGLIGEASYATAQALGIPADPAGGGASKDVTYIFFKNTKARPVESHAAAVRAGDRLARRFVASTK